METLEMARADAVTWASSITTRSDVLYLDTETTGLGATDEVIDIAAVDNDGHVLLNTLVRPHRSIPRIATEIHGITDEMVTDAPDWPTVYPQLVGLFSRYRHVVVYNADFDRRLISQSCAVYVLRPAQARWHCAMKRYAEFVGDQSSSFGDYRWFNLGMAVRRLGLTVVADHRALSDARACRAVVDAMAQY